MEWTLDEDNGLLITEHGLPNVKLRVWEEGRLTKVVFLFVKVVLSTGRVCHTIVKIYNHAVTVFVT